MRKYIRTMYIVFRRLKEFLVNFIGQMMYFPIKFAILYFIWSYIYGNSAVDASYSFEEMLGYYFILAIVQTCIMPCGLAAYEEWETINSGKMNLYLTKPISYPIYMYAEKMGSFLIYMATGLLFIYVTVFAMQFFGVELVIRHTGWFCISLFMGFTIMVNLFTIIGHITFWVENVLSLRDNLWNIIKIFSGEIFPIAMYPLFLQKICGFLPFQYIYFQPISILQGKIPVDKIVQNLAVQAGWCLLLIVVNGIVWKKGNVRYVSQGG